MDKNAKNILIFVMFIIIVFALSFTVRLFYHDEEALTLDDMHQKNLEGEESESNYVYNGYSFVYFDQLWWTQVLRNENQLDVPLHFAPRELEDIEINGAINDVFKQKQIYITFDPTGTDMTFVALSSAELSLNLAKGMEIIPVAACIKNETGACIDRPIITCDDKYKSVIYLSLSNETIVELKGNCVEIKGTGWELVKATDRFLLQWYGVMK